MNTYTFGIARPWEPGTTAIITVTTTKPLRAYDIKQTIVAAVTAWARTPSGAEATIEHRQQGWDFNIGELAGCLDDPALQQTLHDHDITTLKIETVTGADNADWDFDDAMVIFEETAP